MNEATWRSVCVFLLASSFGGGYVAQSLDSDVVSSGLLYVLAV